jgi:allantoicase
MSTTDFTLLTDLASRALGGSVSAANDELFAQRENLIRPEAPFFDPNEFGHKGKVYDGWETRRRRDEGGHDWAIVRLGAPGIVHGVVVDTAYFKGNYPPFVSVEAAFVEGYPSIEEVLKADWQTIVAKAPAEGHTANRFSVEDRHRWTHVRLSIYPDGGVARFRVHGQVVQDPRFLSGTVDLLAAENGGRLIECSDAFYSSPANIILPGRARNMGEGWENSRRRNGGNDFAIFQLAAPGVPRHWTEILPRTAVQPDTRHRFLIDRADAYTHLRLDVYPDGGLSRLRLFGELDGDARDTVDQAWQASASQLVASGKQ